MSFPVRLRHPRGVTTLQIAPETTLEELQVMVFSATEIPLDAQDLKYGYPPKPLPFNVTNNPHGKLSLVPITKGEQIIVTERPPSGHITRSVSRQEAAAALASKTDASRTIPAAAAPTPAATAAPSNFFETAPTPKSTISTATHTPTPAPSVPRTIIPSPYYPNYPGTGPGSASSSTSGFPNNNSNNNPGHPTLAVPSSVKQPPGIGSSPLAERNHPALNGNRDPAHDATHHLGLTNALLTSLTSSSPNPTANPTSVPLPDGSGASLIHRIVPDDNSCLFSAVGLVFMGKYDDAIVKELRDVVVSEIRKDPITYSDVILGRPRDEYIDLITRPSTWGGAIELAVFAKHFKTEISSYDVMTGRADRFGEGEYDNRCILIYSGIHYDAATSSPTPDAPPEFHTSIFPTSDPAIPKAATELVKRLREKHYYTDTQNFDLRCQVCQIGLKGEQGAREHAIKTGHVEFGEY